MFYKKLWFIATDFIFFNHFVILLIFYGCKRFKISLLLIFTTFFFKYVALLILSFTPSNLILKASLKPNTFE